MSWTVTTPSETPDNLLLETGDYLLQENESYLVWEIPIWTEIDKPTTPEWDIVDKVTTS